ncbi:SHOCT domain-containing protein [Nocardia sp. NPDC050413]|uniref:SHOCT domain-containing protein n=1 Tax=Nocardia sp. NPDC050413 TaxID=3155784 RepID=UPI0033FD5B6F
MPLRMGRAGRPGLLGAVARTAVVAGTATATSNAVNNRARRRNAEQQAYADQQLAAQQAYAPPAPPPPAPASPRGGVDVVGELTKLSELRQAGALSDAEFAAAKAKLLG